MTCQSFKQYQVVLFVYIGYIECVTLLLLKSNLSKNIKGPGKVLDKCSTSIMLEHFSLTVALQLVPTTY